MTPKKMTATSERLQQWVEFWRSAGEPGDKGPRRPSDVDAYHDSQLRKVAQKLAAVERERGE